MWAGKSSPTYTPLTFDSAGNELNAIKDIQQALVANVPVALDGAAPVPPSGGTQSYDSYYSSVRTHFPQASTAMANFVKDCAAIPWFH